MDRSEVLLRPWIEHAPTRYFRFAFDMWGDRSERTDRVMLNLARSGFLYAPIRMWFSDTFFMFPHFRAMAQNNARVVDEVEALFIDKGTTQLKSQADGARAATGREVTHIALIHGSPARRRNDGPHLPANARSRRRVRSSRGGDARLFQRRLPSANRAAISQLHAEVVRGH